MEIHDISKVLEHIKILYSEKESLAVRLVEQKQRPSRPSRSESIDALAAALAKAQLEFSVADLNRENPYFKSRYADLKSVVLASRPALNKYGLSVVQNIVTQDDGSTYLLTILLHTTGQYLESHIRMVPPKNDIQSISSYNTYMKRMAYASLVGVVTGDEDDDGEAAVHDSRLSTAKGTSINNNYNPKEVSPQTITREQLEELEYELAEFPDMVEMILDGFKINSLADMPRTKFLASVNKVRELKSLRKGLK